MANKSDLYTTRFIRIKNLLDKHIVRYHHPDGWSKSRCLCVDSTQAIIEIQKLYPELSKEQISEAIGRHLHILTGTLSDFIGGQTGMASELSTLMSK